MLNLTKARGFTYEDLTTAIIRDPVIASPEMTVREAIARMNGAQSHGEADFTEETKSGPLEAYASCVVVVEENHWVIGIFTERDVVRLCANYPLLDEVPVSQVMTAPVLTLRESDCTDLFSVVTVLQQNHIRHLPIVDDQDSLVGLVTYETLQQVLQPTELLHLFQREQVVAHLATQIRSSLRLQTILETAVEQIYQVMGCDRVNIWKLESDSSSIVVAESTHLPRTLIGKQIRDDCFQSRLPEVYRKGYVRVVPDIYTTEMSECHRAFLIHLQIRAKVILPLFCGEQLWGLLNVSESQTARDWQADEIDLLRKLATQLTIAIQQASTHEQLQSELQERQQAETLLQIKNDLLNRVATQVSLTDTLSYVCTKIEQILDGAIGSILLLENNQLRDGAAPGLPDDYRRQIDGIEAGEGVGSCGTAAYRREQVIVADIATDPLWRDFKDLALASGLQACWSTPIVAFDGLVLGTFAIYYRQVRSPRTDEMAIVDSLVHIVMLAIQRHQNEIALKQTNLRLQEAQRIAHLGNWELDLQHNTTYCSEEVLRIFEIDPPQSGTSYETFLNRVHPEDRAVVDAVFNQHLQDLQPYNLVHRLQMPDGRIKYVRAQCVTRYSADGSPLISQGTVQDITQQQEAEIHRDRAEASLRQVIEGTATFTGEAFFPALVRHIAEALGVRYVSVSQATSEGFQVLAFCADGELCPPQFFPYDLVPCCRQALQTGRCCHPEGILALYPDNPLFTDLQIESYLGVGLRNAAGEPTGNLCVLHDAPLADPDWAQTLISIFAARAGAELERLLTAQALEQLNAALEERVAQRTTILAEREARYRGLLEGAADAILLADLQGNILEANQKAEALFGYPLAELTTLHFSQLHPAEALPRARNNFAEIVQKQRIRVLDEIFQRPDGTTVSVDVTATVIDLNGEILVQGIFHDISERKAIQQALQESQQFLQTVLDTVPLSVFWKDRSSNYLGANQRFLRDAALSSASGLVGKTDFDMPWEATEAEAYQADDRAIIESGTAKLGIIETRHQQDGTKIWLETNKLPLRNLAGDVVGVLGTYQDITARRNAEIVLRRQLAAIEAAIDGIAILQDEQYVYLNSSHIALFGYQSTQELVGQSWRILYSPEELERFDQEIWPALHEQMSWQGEVTATRKDGTTFPQQLSLTLSADNILICVCQDISDRKQEQAVLQQKTDELDRFFSLALDLLCIANLEGRFVRLNHQWEKVLGYPLSDLEGSEFMDFVHPDDVEMTLQAMQALEQGEDVVGFTNRYRCRDGSYRWIEWRSAPSGDLVYAAARDITERKQTQNRLTESNYQLAVTNQELARATRLKDEFLANMSHELRTPLNAILGITEGLQDAVFGIVNEKQLKALRTVESSAAHLLVLINDILDVAKIGSGQINLECSQVFLEQLCSSSMAFIKQQAFKKQIHLQTTISPHLPTLFADERRIRQALLNLLTNAVKFTPEGGTVSLTVSLFPPGANTDQQPYLRIAVTDTGIGIAPENTGKLFQPFVQIDSALNRQYTGTGLGLALVKQIVELHGGQVGLTSEFGIGSCFTIDLPYDPTLLPASTNWSIANEDHLSVSNPDDLTSTQAPLILLAEDNPANVVTISSYLEAKGYRLLFAHDGQEAIDLSLSHHPDVILMDVQMPGIDGLEAMKQIRQQEKLRETLIIALTALAMKGDEERCLAAGADYYLSKPVSLKQLSSLIQELLSNRRPE
ncbi:MAG: PAS domain S-box protein [Leptolyngbyaceae cyanobacterium bins.59]|nr:PAS domain S-box protein [Leptolyngbyaceae cyanobacterium bins.59]